MGVAAGYGWISGVAAVLASPAVSWAVEAAHEAGEAHETPSLFAGDLGNVIWTAVIFLLLLFVLGRYAWGPMLAALNRREQFIRDTIEAAERNRAEAERMLQQYQQQIAKSQAEAAAIVEQGRREAEVARQRLHEQAQKEAEQVIQRAQEEIAASKRSAMQDLQNLAADLSVDVASKVLGRQIQAEDQRRLVEESLRQLGQTNGGRQGR